MANDKPKFSAGMVVTVIALVYAVAFGAILDHGVNMIDHHQQNASHSS